MMQIQSPFLWGSNGEKLTPEQVARRHAQADEKLKGVGDTSPVGHWLQGAGRVVNAITGKIQERRADASEKLGMDGADAYVRNDPVLSGLLGGGTAPATAGTPSTGQMPQGVNADSIRAGLVARGLPEHVADGFVMNFQDESGLNPGINEAAPIVPGSRGGFGLAQWTGPRRKALESFAAERGVSVADPDIQLDFLMTELQGPESGAANSILSATDSGQAAAAIVNKFLRPAEEHRASREARYTGGGGMSASGQPMPITGGGEGVVGALASAMSDPWVAKKYGPVIQSLMSQQMARGDMQYQQQLQQSDPQYQLGLQKSQLELDALRNPAAPAPIEINGQLVDPVTRKVLGDYRTPETPKPLIVNDQIIDTVTGEVKGDYRTPDDPSVPTTKNITLSDGSEAMVQWNPVTQVWDRAAIPEGGTNGAGGPTKLTESQSKITLFKTLQDKTTPVLTDLEQQFDPSNLKDPSLGSIPIAGNYFTSPQYQMYQSAASAWAEGALRISTGAAATDPEIKRLMATYFAVPGDTPQTVAFKAQMRNMYSGAVNNALGSEDSGVALPLPSAFAAQVGAPVADPADLPPEGVDPEDWKYMTPEQKAMFQ